jgi:regulatory protein
MAQPALSLRARALRSLARREHTRSELRRKLAPHEETEGQLDALLDALQAQGFLSDERAAASLVHRRAARLGTQRLRQELQAKGLDASTVDAALEGLGGTELERARVLWERKFGAPAHDAAGRARQIRFLLARGFAADTVRRVVRGVEEDF